MTDPESAPETSDSDVEDLTHFDDYDAQADLALPTTTHDGESADDGFVPGMGSVLPDYEDDAGYDMQRDIGS